MMDGIRPCLSLKGECTTMSYDAAILAGIAAIKEISAIELQTTLVGEYIHYAAGHRLSQTSYLADSAT